MKKNFMMRAASVLLVAVMLTTCAISGTFAKYVTADDANDSARVAKWGISLQVVGDLYGKNYLDASDNYKTTSIDDAEISVESSDSSNIIAPGTKNDKGMSFGITGNPEVDYKITATITTQNIFLKEGTYGMMVKVENGFLTEENYTANTYYTESAGVYSLATGAFNNTAVYYTLEDDVVLDVNSDADSDDFYYPVVYALDGDIGDMSYTGDYKVDTLAAIADKIADKLNGSNVDAAVSGNKVSTFTVASSTYDSNVAVDALTLTNMNLKWAWAFSTDTMYDGADTILGNLMAGAELNADSAIVKLTGVGTYGALTENEDYCLNTQFGLDITVEQVD